MVEIYISTDIETNGPIPGPHSMLSLGSVALLRDRTIISSFECNLEILPFSTEHPETMKWWESHQDAWNETRINLRDPNEAIPEYASWLNGLPGKPVFVGYPAAFDFMFVYWYLIRYCGNSPFAHSALDIKTYAMAVFKLDYRSFSKKDIQQQLGLSFFHSHRALDDAKRQGDLFLELIHYRGNSEWGKP